MAIVKLFSLTVLSYPSVKMMIPLSLAVELRKPPVEIGGQRNKPLKIIFRNIKRVLKTAKFLSLNMLKRAKIVRFEPLNMLHTSIRMFLALRFAF